MNSSASPVRLIDVLRNFPFQVLTAIPDDVIITGLSSDSRQVQPGCLFVAVSGGNTDGHRYIPQAIERGAAAVVGEQPLEDLAVPYIRVENSRQSMAYLAAGFYGYPAHRLTVIGVTGTDGKTTTTSMIYAILKAAGIRAGMISTVSAVIAEQVLDTGFHVTTPDAPDIQRYLAQMAEAGLTHVILEATSHGLAQYRVDACEFDIAAVTNITHEHLDYHGTYESYRAAKARLFTGLANSVSKAYPTPRAAILNLDDSSYGYLSSVTTVRQISYGLSPQAQVSAEEINMRLEGLSYTARIPGFRFPIQTNLIGEFNVSNSLAAVAVTAVAMRIDPEAVQKGLATMQAVPGRMERINMGQEFMAVVDFAHTPNALSRVLDFSRQLVRGRVIAVFGSAGLRDRAKRRIMAEVSAEQADLSILTAEDPRSESLDSILSEMAAGAVNKGGIEGKTFWRVPDRGDAIRMAVGMARPGDVVIACGKGHEQSMCFGTIEYPWDDRIAMRAALAELLHVPGPRMPALPTSQENTGAYSHEP